MSRSTNTERYFSPSDDNASTNAVRISFRSRLSDGISRQSALSHTRLIDGDLKKPGAEPGLTAKLRKVAEGLEDRVLCDIFGIGFISYNRKRGRIHASLVRLNQAIEQIMFAALDALYQLRFVGGFGWIFRQERHPLTKVAAATALLGKIFRIFLPPGKHGNEILPAV